MELRDPGWPTPSILIGVSVVRLCSTAVSTVITEDGVAPSPEKIFKILRGSVAKALTISYSGLSLAKDSGWSGYLKSIFLSTDPVLYAFDSFA